MAGGRHLVAAALCFSLCKSVNAYTQDALCMGYDCALFEAVSTFLALGIFTYIATTCLYRTFFHPIASLRGPWWAAVTDWYTVYHCVRQDRHLDFYKLHQKYGPVVRYGPNRVSLNTVSALHTIYSNKANCQKSQIYNAFKFFFKVPSSMSTIDKKAHALKRRINAQALGGSTVTKLEPTMLQSIKLLCSQFTGSNSSEWSDPVDIGERIRRATFDIMGDMTFGENMKMLASKDNRWILDLLPRGVSGINMSGYMPALIKLKLDRLLFRKLINDVYRFGSLSDEQAKRRIRKQREQSMGEDIFEALLQAKDPDTKLGYDEEELVAEAGLFIIAGSDTTSTAITSTIFYLLHYPEAYAQLQTEISHTFSDVKSIRMGPQLSGCKYLRACIDEALRLSPSVGAILPRQVLKGGMVIDSHYFPTGVDIGVSAYSMHHNELVYPDAFAYKPERWLVGETVTQDDVDRAQSAFCAFSLGPTSCVGKSVAYAEMSLILARMIWLFDMRVAPGCMKGEGHAGLGLERGRKDEFQLNDHFTSSHRGPVIQLRKRHSLQ